MRLLVAHLAAPETRDLYLRAGYSSLFAAKDMLRRALPSGDGEPSSAAPYSRHVPTSVKRAVWVRDLRLTPCAGGG